MQQPNSCCSKINAVHRYQTTVIVFYFGDRTSCGKEMGRNGLKNWVTLILVLGLATHKIYK